MDEEFERNFDGIKIPAWLYLDNSLSWTEKILILEIDSLDNNKNKRENGDDMGCFASNKWLADFLHLTEKSTANMIAKLKKAGWIEQLWFDGRRRGLRSKLYESRLHKNVKAESIKIGKQTPQKSEHSLKKFKKESLKTTHTHVLDTPAPAQAGESGVCVDPQNNSRPPPQRAQNGNGNLSKHSEDIHLRYFKFCQKRGDYIHTPGGFVKSLKNGESDFLIDDFLKTETPIDRGTKKARDELKKNCKRCYGAGIEFCFGENGEDLGCRAKCEHLPLVPGEWLYKKAREDLEDAAP